MEADSAGKREQDAHMKVSLSFVLCFNSFFRKYVTAIKPKTTIVKYYFYVIGVTESGCML